MKRIFTFSTILLAILATTSCTVTKRQFRSGWHLEWNKTTRTKEQAVRSINETEIETTAPIIPSDVTLQSELPATTDVVPAEQTFEYESTVDEMPVAAESQAEEKALPKVVQKLKAAPVKAMQVIAVPAKKQLDVRSNKAVKAPAVVNRDRDDGEFLGIENSLWKDYLVGAAIIIGIIALIVLAILYPFVADLLGALIALASVIVVIWAICKVFSFFGDYLFWSGR